MSKDNKQIKNKRRIANHKQTRKENLIKIKKRSYVGVMKKMIKNIDQYVLSLQSESSITKEIKDKLSTMFQEIDKRAQKIKTN